jgi:hypothetical protein
MRDKEAASETTARIRVRARSVLSGLLLGGLIGACAAIATAPPKGARFEARQPWVVSAPAAQDWPRPPRAGERVRLEWDLGGATLVVTGADATGARSLARAFAGWQSPGERALHDALARLRLEWRGELPASSPPHRTRVAECASILFARAIWGRTLADRLPIPAPAVPPEDAVPPEAVLSAWNDVREAASDADPKQLLAALHDAATRETAWFANPELWPGELAPARAERWRRWQDHRAEELEARAERMLDTQSLLQRRFAELAVHPHLVAFDEGISDPWQPFPSPDPTALRPLVRPIARVWLPPIEWGAVLGAAFALGLTLLRAWRRARALAAEAERLGPLVPDASEAGPSLHVISGPTAAAVTRGALELAARRLALGERVLLVDGSARLRLHERLGRDARWGLLECLAAEMPVLGLVQYAGHPGLYVLPHGNADRAVGWSRLGQKLEEVVPHFGRIVLALDPQAPAEVGDALLGCAMEGWWGQLDAGFTRAMDQAMARFGIIFHSLDLEQMPEATLEALAARVGALRPAGPVPEPAPITAAVPVHRLEPQPPALEPIVLDCDLQVLERLRFLAWMRRLQADHRDQGLEATT